MLKVMWGYSSVGRAPALHAGGQEFESLYLHQKATNYFVAFFVLLRILIEINMS